MLEYRNRLIMKARSTLATLLHSFLLPIIEPCRVPIPVKANPEYRTPDRPRERAYSKIHPPSTTQL